jgi:hypothetical protein
MLTRKPITGCILSIPVWRIESRLNAVSLLLRTCSHGRKSCLADRAKPLLRRKKEGPSRLTHSLLSSVKRLRRLKRLKRLKRRTWGNQSRAATSLNRTKDPNLRNASGTRRRRRQRRRDPQRLGGISESSHSQCLRVRHDANSLQ